jgi:penicillin-binding protein 1A
MPELGFEFDDDILDFLTNNKEISKSDLVKYLPKYKDKNDQILSIVKGSQWNVIKSSYLVFKDSVRVVFDKKVKMQVFDHKLGRKTVIMSPKDSVLFHLQHLQGGLLALDPKTGFVKAWVGGLDYEYFKFDHCTAYRQVGSTVKPFVYATTMESKGIKPCTYYPDMPYTITPGESKFILSQEWKPDNSTENFTYNPYNLYHGLLYSKNSITVKLMKELGDAEPLRQTLKRVGMDIDKILPNGQIAVPNVPSICLGAIDATLFDMVGAYTSFVNEGVYSKPQIIKRIEDRQGRVIYQGYSPKQKAIDPLVSSALLEMLENNCKGDFKFNFKSKVGGKTGTTNDYIDGWFLGITPGLVVGTWSGGEERFIRFTTLDDGQGYVTARPMFEKFVQRLEKNVKSFNPSANFPKKHPDLEKINNCSHRKVIYPAMERRLRQMAEDNPSMRDSIMRVLRVN